MAIDVGAARQRIIRRPRLTSMLDDSSARIRLLIAPAGYGKTTLAREWLGEPERHDVWYRGGPASADVAALAAGIAEAASIVVPDAGKRMRDRLPATGHPEEDVDILAELFAEDVQEWPSDAWLAFDDYHFAMDSVASERFVDFLTQQTPMQMLITSRRRPSWATARRILYGEIFEIDRRALAMEDSEAREVLGRENEATNELIARARGWPAVLGLAALTGGLGLPERRLPDALHDYFAEELVQAVTPVAQAGLSRLAAFPALSHELATRMLGNDARVTIAEGMRIGALTRTDESFELHPLLRHFLLSKLREEQEDQIHGVAERAVQMLLSARCWDEAFEVIGLLEAPYLTPVLLTAALDDLLREGRTQTVTQWLEFAEINHVSAPIVDLAESEVVFRQGQYARAEALASAAAETLEASELKARALVRAGQAAMLDSRDEQALRSFRQARLVGRTDHDHLEAIVGECFAVLELGLSREVEEAFARLDQLGEGTLEMRIRQMMARLVRAARMGGITAALQAGAGVLPLLESFKEPLATTSFRNAYAHLLALNARYEEALDLARYQFEFASKYRLDFVKPHTRLVSALAYSGIREFTRALEQIDAAEEEERGSRDIHISMYSAALRARIAIERQDFESALGYTGGRWERPASAAMQAELVAYRCLAAACRDDLAQSEAIAKKVKEIRGAGVEARAVTACAEAVRTVRSRCGDAAEASAQAFEVIELTGAYDCFVTAARGSPDFLLALLSGREYSEQIALILAESNDLKLARLAGLKLEGSRRGPAGSLTPRELEVARLVSRGHTNHMIAEVLFISDSTVKVHIRHILEKLGARSRAELAARIATLD